MIFFRSIWIFFFGFCLLAEVGHAESISPECLEFVKSLPIEFQNYGVVKVPLNPESPSANETIDLFYWGNFDPTKDKTPIIYANGGPGLSSEKIWRMKFGTTFGPNGTLDPNEIKMVFFNQRGLGCNDHFPEDFSKLVFYGPRQTAYDIEFIRKQLVGENGRAIVLGQSYGSTAAFFHQLIFPFSPTTVAVTGTVGAARDILIERLINQAKTLELYFAQHPEDRARVKALRDMLTEEDCIDAPAGRICGTVLVDALAALHLMREEGSKISRKAVHEYLETSFKDLKHLGPHSEIVSGLSDLLQPAVEFVFKSPDDPDLAIHDFIEFLSITGIRPADGAKEARQGLVARGLDPDAPLMSELRVNDYLDRLKASHPLVIGVNELASRVQPDIARPEDCAAALIANSDRHFLVFSASDDPLAPPRAVGQLIGQIRSAAGGVSTANLHYHALERGGHALDLDPNVYQEIMRREHATAQAGVNPSFR